MNTWEELVRKVLVGNITGNELNPCFLKKIEAFGINLSQSKEPEKTLLKVITIQSKLYSIAQLPLNSIYPNNVACPKENFQYCNNSRKKQLQYILKNKNDQFLTEILEKLSKKNKLVSPDLLPELLDLGSSYPNLQILITKCIGERGVWLSQFSDKWNYVKNQNGTNDNIFFYGSIDERVCYIKKVHKTKPSHAINLIEKVWENEGFMVRSALIKALKLSLTNNDEPFLEKAINDSRHEVRKHAASLLGCLPQSRLVCRMKTLMTQIATYNTTTELLNCHP